MMATTDEAALATAAERLHDLAANLDQRGFSARVLVTGEKLRLWVQHRSIFAVVGCGVCGPG